MPNTIQPNDRRRDIRVMFRTTVKLSFSEGRTVNGCETMDVSVSGVFVKGVQAVAVGEKCQVEVQLSGKNSNLMFVMAGEVVRIQEDGVAVQFSEVDDDSFYHLQNIVYFNYKHAGGGGEVPGDGEDLDDEALYGGLETGTRKVAPLPDDYLDDINGGEDFDGEAAALHISEKIRRRFDDDDY